MTAGHTATRRAGRSALGVWMNNVRVGTWSRTAADVDVFAYDLAWTKAEQGRPLSLTLPFLPGNGEHRGAHVANWFENLLPDSTEIRSRIARRFGVRNSARQHNVAGRLSGTGVDAVTNGMRTNLDRFSRGIGAP